MPAQTLTGKMEAARLPCMRRYATWHATLHWRPTVIKPLLGAGADPGVKNTDGKVPWDFVEDRDELKDYE